MKIKLIIWDLDDTLWKGTLAEGDQLELYEHRAEIIRKLNQCGIVSAICSKNDYVIARQTLESMNIWDQFVFPRIVFQPKASIIKQLIEDMQLRPINVLFIDDNPHNLNEVKALLTEINILDANQSNCDECLQNILEENQHISKSRIEEYRILQAKLDDKQHQAVSNEEFLRSCDIKAVYAFRMEMLDFVERIEELVNRSNQLNYTQSRLEPGSIVEKIIDVGHYNTWTIFVWDKYGYYGLVGFMMVARTTIPKLIHFVFSCRVMHMGIEQKSLKIAMNMFPNLDISAMILPMPAMQADWIEQLDFQNSAIRNHILAKETHFSKKEASIRIMLNCQSGGLAHFSKYREIIEFDSAPNIFSLPQILSGEHEQQHYPATLIYGAATDYSDVLWPIHTHTNLNEHFSHCVTQFCDFIHSKNCKMLVILPPENLSDIQYNIRQNIDYSRSRTIQFNTIWRENSKKFSSITLLELSALANPEEAYDVAHYYAGLLKKISHQIDTWYESIEKIIREHYVAII